MSYLFIGDHPEVLASGRTVAPGEDPIAKSALNLDDPTDKRLVDEGLLIEAKAVRAAGGKDTGVPVADTVPEAIKEAKT